MNRHTIIFTLVATFAGMSAPGATSAAVITKWTFNSPSLDNAPTTGSSVPEIGVGQISTIGGINQTFAQGSSNDNSPSGDFNNNSSYNTFNYPPFDSGNLTAGIQIAVDTTGYKDIVLSFEHRHAAGASRSFAIQYASNGVNYVNITGYDAGLASNVFHLRGHDFSEVAALDNNPNARFRIVAEFFSQTSYHPAGGGPNYMSSADNRFDLITVSGTPIPEPTGAVLLLAGPLGVTLLGRAVRSRRSS